MGGGARDLEAHLEDVVPGLHVGYVDPLAVDVRVVSVIAAGAQALGKGTGGAWGACPPQPPPRAHVGGLGPPSLAHLPTVAAQSGSAPSSGPWVRGPER